MAEIQVSAAFKSVQIHINGVLHLRVSRPILGVQSWIESRRTCYVIQYTLPDGEITTEYDDIENWKTVLSGLEKVL
jgi:hypothetical protein